MAESFRLKRLAIAGASVRAAAFSALRAGYDVVTADLFADADLRAHCDATRIEAGYPEALADWLAATECDGWLFTGALENHHELINAMAKLRPLMGSVNTPGNPEKDAGAYIAFLDAQKEVDKKHKIGTQGYCMGGPLVVRTAAAFPDRVGAGASFHGGGLVTDKPESPHLLAPKIKARMYFGVAGNDDQRQPDAKTKLKEAFEAAKVPVEVELYATALHGWCIADMPMQGADPIYKKDDAEKAWAKLLALYKAGL